MTYVTIHDEQFFIPGDYSSGHVINEAEAFVLNKEKKENIVTNLKYWLQQILSSQPKNKAMLPEIKEAITAKLIEYGQNYKFKSKNTKTHIGLFAGTVRELAEAEVAVLCGKGEGAKYELELTKALASDKIRKMAEAKIANLYSGFDILEL